MLCDVTTKERIYVSRRYHSLIRNTHPNRIIKEEDEQFKKCLRFMQNRYMGTSLIRNTPPVGPYSSPMPRDVWWS